MVLYASSDIAPPIIPELFCIVLLPIICIVLEWATIPTARFASILQL